MLYRYGRLEFNSEGQLIKNRNKTRHTFRLIIHTEAKQCCSTKFKVEFVLIISCVYKDLMKSETNRKSLDENMKSRTVESVSELVVW